MGQWGWSGVGWEWGGGGAQPCDVVLDWHVRGSGFQSQYQKIIMLIINNGESYGCSGNGLTGPEAATGDPTAGVL